MFGSVGLTGVTSDRLDKIEQAWSFPVEGGIPLQLNFHIQLN